MDLNSLGKNVKRDLKAELTPKKVLRAAFVPQTKGLLTPLKDVFGIFVTIIAQLFVQAKLLPVTHPGVTKELSGFNAIWSMILDASANLKFRKENIYQIVIFYGIVGMLIFGVLDLATFLMHFSLGSAHAQAINDTGSLFNEVSNDNGPTWINYMFPYANNAAAAGGLPGALQGMLLTYNSAILALATVLALYQIVTLFMESAHSGQYGGGRYSQLYAPLRLVMGIGLLIPISNGFNTGQIIAIDMAKMGSGLASNVWTAFENQLASIGNNSADAPIADINPILQKLLVDETCMAATMDYNSSTPDSITAADSTIPTWDVVELNGALAAPSTTSDSDQTATSFVINFDNQKGDAFCGSITIPAQRSSAAQMGQVNWFEQAFVGNSGILASVWSVATTIYYNSKGGATDNAASADPTLNPFATGNTPGSWATWVGTAGKPTMTAGDASPGAARTASYSTGNGIIAGIQNASTNSYNDYQNNVVPSLSNPATADWTRAGYLFLQMSHNAGDLYTMQNPNIAVSLPDPTVMPSSSGQSANPCPSWYDIFSTAPFSCSDAGKAATSAIYSAIKDIKAGVQSAGVSPVAFDPASIGSGNDGGKVNGALSGPFDSLVSAIGEAYTTAGAGATDATQPNMFGQSIFNVMFLGNVIIGAVALMYVLSAAVGSSLFGLDAGLIVALIGTAMWPIGIGLAVMVPLMPAARFIFGLFTWVMTLFEAMVAIPVMALVSIKSDGEGLFAHGHQGWLLLVQMMLRPVLMIFGLIGSVIVFDTLAGFINTTIFGVWFGLFNSSGGTGVVSALLGMCGFLYFYLATIYSCANLSFGMINAIPDRVLQWIGGNGIFSSDDTTNVLQTAQTNAGQMTNRAAAGIGGAIQGARDFEKLPSGNAGGSTTSSSNSDTAAQFPRSNDGPVEAITGPVASGGSGGSAPASPPAQVGGPASSSTTAYGGGFSGSSSTTGYGGGYSGSGSTSSIGSQFGNASSGEERAAVGGAAAARAADAAYSDLIPKDAGEAGGTSDYNPPLETSAADGVNASTAAANPVDDAGASAAAADAGGASSSASGGVPSSGSGEAKPQTRGQAAMAGALDAIRNVPGADAAGAGIAMAGLQAKMKGTKPWGGAFSAQGSSDPAGDNASQAEESDEEVENFTADLQQKQESTTEAVTEQAAETVEDATETEQKTEFDTAATQQAAAQKEAAKKDSGNNDSMT